MTRPTLLAALLFSLLATLLVLGGVEVALRAVGAIILWRHAAATTALSADGEGALTVWA